MGLQRLLVVSDVHSNLPAYLAIKDLAKEKYGNIDYMIGLGDFVGYGPHPNEILSQIQKDLDVAVIGNHDLAALTGNLSRMNPYAQKALLWTIEQLTVENKAYLQVLTKYEFVQFQINGLEVFACHGSPKSYLWDYVWPKDSTERKEELLDLTNRCHLLLLGHTHIPFVYTSPKGGVIANPGSVGQPRDGIPKASAMIVEVSDDGNAQIEWLRANYDIVNVAKDIKEAGLPHRLAERLFFGL